MCHICNVGRITSLPDDIKIELDNFLAPFKTEKFLDDLVQRAKLDRNELEYTLAVVLNEVYVGIDVIWADLEKLKPKSILEIGAGFKLVSYFLIQKGYEVTALEPFQKGFGFFEYTGELIDEYFEGVELNVLPIYAEELDVAKHGTFDYLFSVNVLEHIHKLEEAVEAMESVLNPGGAMRHTCPNYSIPYEVHLGIPLLPINPILTRYFVPTLVKENQDMWDSLNFITYKRLNKALSKQNLTGNFRSGLTYDAFARLKEDKVFSERHGSTWAGRIFKVLDTTKLLGLLKHLPLNYTTPMEFITFKK